jgi:predicted nucleotidyltransferase
MLYNHLKRFDLLLHPVYVFPENGAASSLIICEPEESTLKTALIVAEFNPYHNGHKYIAEKTRELTGADYVIALMSGDYVQRGAPAMIGRHARVRMALSSGIDMVIAFPTRYATCSAEEYAANALRIADSLGCVDYLFFGSECGDIDILTEAARVLAFEPDDYKEQLREHLRHGLSFPRARALALPQFEDLLGGPNNILGIEYIKAILRGNYNIRPETCARIGAAHESSEVAEEYASATAIRELLSGQKFSNRDTLFSQLSSCIPAQALDILRNEYENNRLVYENDLSVMLASALWAADSPAKLIKYTSVSETLANAVWSSREKCLSFTEYAMLLKNRSLTYTHVCRALLHISLGIEKNPASSDFAHILGMRKEAGPLASRMMESALIPVIMRPARELMNLNEDARHLFDEEIRLSNIYNILVGQKSGQDIQNEMSYRLITV